MPTCPKCKYTWSDTAPPDTTKKFVGKITFERTSDKGEGAYHGTAAVLFGTEWAGKITELIVNGELAKQGVSYKGRPVFRLLKTGDKYSRPLRFVIKTTEGTYTATSGTSSPASPGTTDPPVSGYAHKSTYTSYGVRNGGRQAWRISKKGPDFGRSIKLVFANGQTFNVSDTSKNFRDINGSRTSNRKDPRCGFVFKPGIGPNGDGDSDTGTSHGGVYLHAPYGNHSTTVTIYYN